MHEYLTPFSLGSCQGTLQSYLTVQSYARQINILTNRKITLGVYRNLSGKVNTDLSVENMNPNVTLYGI
jgi:hypothetical protein